MPVLKMNRPAFGFIVSESNDWRSRDEVLVSTDEDIRPASLLMAGATPADALVAWNGTADAVGILCQGVQQPAVDDPTAEAVIKRTLLSRQAEVVGADLVLPDGVELAAAIDALLPLGIIVRTNPGMYVDVVAPSAT